MVVWLALVGGRALLDDLVGFGPFHVAYLAEVAQEVGPHDVVLVDVGALDLRHGDEVLRQQVAVVGAHAPHLRQALIAVEEELFALRLELLALACQHESEALLLVVEQLVLSPDEVVLGPLEAPPGDVLRLE